MLKLIDIMTFVVFSTLCNVYSTKVVNSFVTPSLLLKRQQQHALRFSPSSSSSKRGRISYYQVQDQAAHYVQTKLFSTEASDTSSKARVVFLGTPDVAATTLERIVEESKKDKR